MNKNNVEYISLIFVSGTRWKHDTRIRKNLIFVSGTKGKHDSRIRKNLIWI